MPGIDFEDTHGSEPCMLFDGNNDRAIMAHYLNGTKVFELLADGFIYTTSGWKYRYAVVNVGDIAADSTLKYPLLRCKHNVTITNVYMGTDTTAAASGTNYTTVSIYNSGIGTGTALSTLTNASTAFTLKEDRAFASLNSTVAALAAGDTLYMSIAGTGDGAALSGVTVCIAYTIDQAIPACSTAQAEDNLFRYMAGASGTDGLVESDHLVKDHMVMRRKGVEYSRININGVHTGIAPDQYYYHVLNFGDITDSDTTKKCTLFKPHCTVQIEHIYFGQSGTAAADADTNYLNVLIRHDSDETLVENSIHGPYNIAESMTAGYLYDMGEVSKLYGRMVSGETLEVQFLTPGTATTVTDLTIVVCYRKLD